MDENWLDLEAKGTTTKGTKGTKGTFEGGSGRATLLRSRWLNDVADGGRASHEKTQKAQKFGCEELKTQRHGGHREKERGVEKGGGSNGLTQRRKGAKARKDV